MTTFGLLHPGSMGSTVGRALVENGHRVVWAGDARSNLTRHRAVRSGLDDVGTVERVVEAASTILSICPPGAAVGVAASVIESGFRGCYVDANAVSPETAAIIDAMVEGAGARYVDGGIIGPPALAAGTTRLYLSGDDAAEVAAAFAASRVEAIAITGGIGAASALKLSYAAWTKGSSALLLTVRAAAEAAGVTEALLGEWERSQPGVADRSESTAAGSAPKAWRWVAEMEEIGAFLTSVGLPPGAFTAAAEVFGRLEDCKDQFDPPLSIDTVIDYLNQG